MLEDARLALLLGIEQDELLEVGMVAVADDHLLRAPGLAAGLDRAVFFFQAEDGIRDADVTGVQTCAHPISARTGQGWGLNTTTGVVPGTGSIPMRREIACTARLPARPAMAAASPSWSRASSYASSMEVPARTSWNWLNSTCRQACDSSAVAGGVPATTAATAVHFSAASSRFSARRFQRLTPACAE